MVDEEGVDQGAERLSAGHGMPADHAGWAKASNRWLASASSWGVIVSGDVRYRNCLNAFRQWVVRRLTSAA
jgi:hypothetical protein